MIARIESGQVRSPPKVDLLDSKSGLFEPHPPQPSYIKKKNIFGPLKKVDLLPHLGGVLQTTPPPPGLLVRHNWGSIDQVFKKKKIKNTNL